MRIAVCDDVPFWAERVSECIENWAHERGVNVNVTKCISGEEVLFEMEVSGDFTVVFMDVRLKGMSGMDTTQRIRERDPWVSVVFVTSHDKYCKEMFRFSPVHFMEKPVIQKKTSDIMDKVVEERRYFYGIFDFKYNHRNYHIALDGVLYFVSEGRTVKILLESGEEYTLYGKLSKVEKYLQRFRNCFIRIHQSYLVNSVHVERYHRKTVVLRNKVRLPVSRNRREAVTRFHSEYLAMRN